MPVIEVMTVLLDILFCICITGRRTVGSHHENMLQTFLAKLHNKIKNEDDNNIKVFQRSSYAS